jgi:O-antigen/teichoic acid export membrane protein
VSGNPGAPAPALRVDKLRAREIGVALRNGIKMGGSLIVTWSVALFVKVHALPSHMDPILIGKLGFADGFAASFFTFVNLGVDTHLIKEIAIRPKYASEVVGGLLALRLLLSITLLATMAGVLWHTHRIEVLPATAVFGLAYLLMALNATYGAVLQANARVDAAILANIVTKLAWGIGILWALHEHASLAVLALPVLVGEFLRLTIMAPATQWGTGLRYRIDLAEVRDALVASVPYYVNSLALGVLSNLGISALEFLATDKKEVGWFSSVQNLAQLCSALTPMLFWVVMPLLSRAQARSYDEGMAVFRRCLDGIVVTIVPITALLSAGADVLIAVAFHPRELEYAPAHTALSILSLVFVLTYISTMLAMALIVGHRGWSVTVISVGAVFVTAGLMFVCVPLGRRFVGIGGESAGAAAAVIGSEVCTVVAMLSRFRSFPLDARNLTVFGKSVATAAVMLLADRHLRALGALRLVLDATLYLGMASALRIVSLSDIRTVLHLIRHRADADPESGPRSAP